MEKTFFNALKLERINEDKDNGRVLIEGYACHFGKPNGNGEIVDEESFKDCLKLFKEGGQMPVFNYQHTDQIIGGWDEITTNTVGIYVKGHINTNVAYVRDNIMPLVKGGDVCHLSTEGWYEWNSMEERESGYYVGKCFLYGISLVALPADFGAKAIIKNGLAKWREENEPKKKNIVF